MDVFDENILNFWKALRDHHVKYIMVGGYATILHGYERFTGDLDIWLKDTRDNRRRLRKTLAALDIGDYPMIETMEFVPGCTQFHLNNGLQLDILTEMKGLEDYTFEECLQMASVAAIEGVNIPFLHINQLIQNKKVINRLKDKLDVLALEDIKKLRDESEG